MTDKAKTKNVTLTLLVLISISEETAVTVVNQHDHHLTLYYATIYIFDLNTLKDAVCHFQPHMM